MKTHQSQLDHLHTLIAERLVRSSLQDLRSVDNWQVPGLHQNQASLPTVRWKEALSAGVAPQVHLEATHAKTLEVVTLEQLKLHAL